MLAFATDLYDEGLDTVLGNVQERAAVDGLTMAVVYHDARDLSPTLPAASPRSSGLSYPILTEYPDL